MGRSYEERVSSYRKTFGPEQMAQQSSSRTQETREQISYRYTLLTEKTFSSEHVFLTEHMILCS